ncbi:MAG: hypothetical protein ABIT76_14050 [Chthoniobacterales bacterium]
MSKPKSPTLAQKKKRLVQLRDAQRRRRERLRAGKQFFVQIILPEKTLQQLTRMIEESGETMQQIIARLVQSTLPVESDSTLAQAAEPIAMEVVPEPEEEIVDFPEVEEIEEMIPEPALAAASVEAEDFSTEEELEETPLPEIQEPLSPTKAGQLDLFG